MCELRVSRIESTVVDRIRVVSFGQYTQVSAMNDSARRRPLNVEDVQVDFGAIIQIRFY